MKLIKVKQYYINTNNISYIEIGNKKCINQKEIDEFNKQFKNKVIELFGENWKFDYKVRIKDSLLGIEAAYSYMDVHLSNNELLREHFLQKLRKAVFDNMNEPFPEKQFEFEYTIHFIGNNDTISDTFTKSELELMGISSSDIDTSDTDDILKTFLNFE